MKTPKKGDQPRIHETRIPTIIQRLLSPHVLRSISEIRASWLRQRSGSGVGGRQGCGGRRHPPSTERKVNPGLRPVFNHRSSQPRHNTEGIDGL